MANQALINAAQRMYSAKAAKAQKDIKPILQGASNLTSNVIKALDDKQKEQEEKAAKQTESFNDIILKSGKARPELTNELKALQDEYYNNLKISEGIFKNKNDRAKAVERNNDIATTLKLWQDDLTARDLIAQRPTNMSDFNGIIEKGEEVSYRDDTLAENLIYKPDGVYTTNLKGEEVRLSEYKPPVGKFQKGIDAMVSSQQSAVKAGNSGLDWDSYALPGLANNINKLMDDPNYGSLMFDNIGNFNWATQQMEQEFPDADLSNPNVLAEKREELRNRVKTDPDRYKQEFKDDVLRAYRNDYSDAADKAKAARNKADESDGEDMSATINALNKGAKIIPLPGKFGTGVVAAKKSDGKYYISSGAKASAPLDPETPGQGFTLKELADVLGAKYSSDRKNTMDLNNDGRISEEEFNAAFNKNIIGNRGSGPLPQLNLPVK
ncbi:hypothetical protein N9D80_01370 [Flavobacteriales bacterium]|nr:hypothetical protein [Flavobacteriales bacterium]